MEVQFSNILSNSFNSLILQSYLNLLQHILENGVKTPDRTGVGTIGCFGYQLRHDLSKGFPLLTTKKIHFKAVVHELLWFLKGSTNIQYLKENGVTIWDEWADADGELGPIYGKQWRSWEGADGQTIDQISNLIEQLKSNPYSRRHVVSAWNVADVPNMAIPPCHTLFQFHVAPPDPAKGELRGRLSCQMYQRSGDAFLGVPFNIASYSLLTMMVAQVCGFALGDFIHSFGDLHIYNNHIEQVKLQLGREPLPLPNIKINPDVRDIDGFCYDDFKLENYFPHPAIRAAVAV